MFQINVKNKNIPKIQKALEELDSHLIEDKMLLDIAALLHARIVARTLQGKDADNKPFAPYSPKYRAYRLKMGRPVAHVDLFFKGHMLGAITERVVAPGKVKIFFADAMQAAKAHGHQTGWRHKNLKKRRRFFAFSDEDIELAVKEAKKLVAKKKAEAGL